MKKQKWSLIAALLYITAVFALGRIQVEFADLVALHDILYILVFFALTTPLVIPLFRRAPWYFVFLMWAVLLLGGRLLLGLTPLWGSMEIYRTITELSLLAVAVWLGRLMADSFNEVESFIEAVTLPREGQRILDKGDSTDEIKVEFIRSRRHNRPLSIIMLEPASRSLRLDLERTLIEIQRKMAERFLVASLAEIINKEVRRTDIIVNQGEDGRFVVLCPETTPDGSVFLAERIQAVISEKLNIPMAFGSASFPDQAVTFEDLVSHAEFELTHYAQLPNPAEKETDPLSPKSGD